MSNVISFLHLMPLVMIAGLFVVQKLGISGVKLAGKSNIITLILASVGIIAGAFEHNHVISIVDPCFGYAASLLHVAYSLTKNQAVKAVINKK